MKELLLRGQGLCKSFGGGGDILDHICADVYAHDFTVIMGPSGAGKSTLLYSLSGMDSITGGEVFYKGEKISGYSEAQMARLRSREFPQRSSLWATGRTRNFSVKTPMPPPRSRRSCMWWMMRM